jgi:methyl-accepting chemotaxis protein
MIEELQVGARGGEHHEPEPAHSESSVGIANQAGERLGSVTQRIGEIDGMNQSVATATEEQTAVVESINVDITEINTLNQEGVETCRHLARLLRPGAAGGAVEASGGQFQDLISNGSGLAAIAMSEPPSQRGKPAPRYR